MGGIGNVATFCHHKSGHIQCQQKQVRQCDAPVEIGAPDNAALACNVEPAKARIDKGKQRGKENVRR